jgi:hypothetical protein
MFFQKNKLLYNVTSLDRTNQLEKLTLLTFRMLYFSLHGREFYFIFEFITSFFTVVYRL